MATGTGKHSLRAAAAIVAILACACDARLHVFDKSGNTAPAPQTITLLEREKVTFKSESTSAYITLRVPAETQSLVVTVEGKRGGAYVVSGWKDDDDKELINFFNDQFCKSCSNRVIINEIVATAYLGNNPTVRYAAGEHTLRISGVQYTFDPSNRAQPLDYTQTPAGGFVLVSAIANVMPKVPATATVDINFNFTGAAGWTAALGPTNVDLQAALARMRALLAMAGIAIGNITYRDVSSDFDAIEHTGGPDSDLVGLRMSGKAETGINVYFTSLFLDDGAMASLKTLGLSGGIPGPMRNGTPQDGVVIAVDGTRNPADGPIDAKLLGSVMAHECGHYLGLFHTHELALPAGDHLPDTEDSDTTNLMYPVAGAQEHVSDSQALVLRKNPRMRYESVGDVAEVPMPDADDGGSL